jgi:hypothetical protein
MKYFCLVLFPNRLVVSKLVHKVFCSVACQLRDGAPGDLRDSRRSDALVVQKKDERVTKELDMFLSERFRDRGKVEHLVPATSARHCEIDQGNTIQAHLGIYEIQM